MRSLLFSRAVFIFLALLLTIEGTARIKGVSVNARGDRYGSNVVAWIPAIIIAQELGLPLYHQCHICRWRPGLRNVHKRDLTNKVFHKILKDSCSQIDSHKFKSYIKRRQILSLDLSGNDCFLAIQRECNRIIGCSIRDRLESSGLKEKWYAYFEDAARENGWSLRWRPENSVVIHVRLEDVRNQSNGAWQSYIGDDNLQTLVQHLHKRFPKHELHLVTSPHQQDIDRCKRLMVDFPYVAGVWGDRSEDYALWQMMNSDVLILSHSTFPVVSGLLQQGRHTFIYADNIIYSELHKWEKLDLEF